MRSSKCGRRRNALVGLIRSKQAGLGQALVILVMILPQMATDGKKNKGSEIQLALQ